MATTLRKADGGSFRLLVTPLSQTIPPQTRADPPLNYVYEDFEWGVLSIEDDHPAYEWLLAWARKQDDIAIFNEKTGFRVCPICGQAVGNEDQEALHMREAHIETGEEEESGRPRGTPRRAGAPVKV